MPDTGSDRPLETGENTLGLEKLTESVRQLHGLLQDPEPGLFTWHECTRRKMREVRNLLNEILKES